MSPGGGGPPAGSGVSRAYSSTYCSVSRRNAPNATASSTMRRCTLYGSVSVSTLPVSTASRTLESSSSALLISLPPLSSSTACCISRCSSSRVPNRAPVCRSASASPSLLTIVAVCASVSASNASTYARSAPFCGSLPTPGSSSAGLSGSMSISGPTSAASSESAAAAEAKSSSSAATLSSALLGMETPSERSSWKVRSTRLTKYPNMMLAAYTCAPCSFDMRIRALENGGGAPGPPSTAPRCSLTISRASGVCTPLVSRLRSTPRISKEPSSGGRRSTPSSTNLCSTLAYIKSCTVRCRCIRFTSSMRLYSTKSVDSLLCSPAVSSAVRASTERRCS
mmetsp:Transcript_23755/g.80930  ORF Transcript_23755/g.80930 Transcript_23755/m.80930 type:complete len:338 (+) Transcript_23755:147-1160(+)